MSTCELHERNRSWLEAMAASPDRKSRLRWRNALVEGNLALVRMVAQRQSLRSGQPFDELVSAGNMGLIRAVEAFDLRQRCNLSSFAVPYIRGAMLHDIRDHGQPLRTPRRLRELQQRARRLQEQRRCRGLVPLASEALASELGCRTEQLEEAAAVHRALQVRSLDAPLGDGDGGEPTSLLDQLAAQGTATCSGADGTDPGGAGQALQQWLQRQLEQLETADRLLLEGYWFEGRSWKELALQLRLGGREAQRRGEVLLARLQAAAGTAPASAMANSMASKAAMAV